MKLTLSVQSACKKSHLFNLPPKIDFIEKTCPAYNSCKVKAVYGLWWSSLRKDLQIEPEK